MTLAIGYSLPGVMGVIGTVIAFYMWYVSPRVILAGRRVHMLTTLQVLPYNSYSLRDGRYECHAAQSAAALGRSHEQAFYRRWHNVSAIQLQAVVGGRTS
jgi:hypothetical protein